MNYCEYRHEPKYQITYKSSTIRYHSPTESVTCDEYNPVWLVCESCMKDKECFGSNDEIKTVEVLA